MINLKKQLTFASVLAVSLGLMSNIAVAAKLASGTVISSANLEQVKNDTFEGKTIASMLPERIEWMIREQGLKIKLRPSAEVPMDPRYVAATKKYAGDVKFNSETRLVEGWKAGMPFPNVSMKDPDVAEKLIWNHHYGAPHQNYADYPKFAFLFIDGDKGLERTQHWVLKRYYMKGRLGEESTVEGDGSVLAKQLLFATYPRDIRGLGTFTLRYDDPKVEDTWAYIRTVRRTRRLSGGAWMDPIGGTDQLNDDIEIFNAHPKWYSKYKLLGKRWVLAVAHSQVKAWDENASGNAEFPIVDSSTAPYWNPVDEWEPREVYVIEATTPEQHPYSKKILYMDAKFPRFYFAEAYDRKGDFWKMMTYSLKPYVGEDGGAGVISAAGFTIDYQRRHATVFISHPSWKLNPKGGKARDVTLGVLESSAR